MIGTTRIRRSSKAYSSGHDTGFGSRDSVSGALLRLGSVSVCWSSYSHRLPRRLRPGDYCG